VSPTCSLTKTEPSFLDLSFPDDDDDEEYHPSFEEELEARNHFYPYNVIGALNEQQHNDCILHHVLCRNLNDQVHYCCIGQDLMLMLLLSLQVCLAALLTSFYISVILFLLV